ncbi:MAG: dihydrofolate reductase family protein [Bdellovibrionales bacterium]|nr:dihydrofolate reductase family protein [Bdellovibrionales bacterium]
MFVSINMACSIDGKIATPRRGPVKLGSDYDSRRMAEIRADHDAVVMGGSTYRAHPFALRVDDEALVRARLARGKPAHPITVVVSRRLAFPATSPLARDREVERWMMTGARPSNVARWEKAGVLVKRARAVTPERILRELGRGGAEKVLLEGGGELNALFLEKDLVDRIHLTVCPLVLGGADSPTIFGGRGFTLAKAPRFRLTESRPVGDEIYLTYDRLNRSR